MKRKQHFLRIIIHTLIFGGVLFFLSGPITEVISNILNFTTNSAEDISQSTQSSLEKISSTNQLINKQKAQIKKLQEKLKKAEFEASSFSAISNDLDNVDQLLKLKTKRFPKSVPAKVIARSPSSWHKQILINKGSNSGIKPGMVVVTPKGVLGQIQEAKDKYSIVQLISSSQVRFGGEIKRTGVLGIITGDKAGYALLQFIPIGSDVKQGDTVTTTQINPSGIKKLYPFAYPVGKVVSLTRLKNNSEMFIKVKLFEDGSRTSEVLVLLPGGDRPLAKP